MAKQPVGYYVHHDGSGHMMRAIAICARIDRPVVMFSSLPRPRGLPPHITYISLPDDMVDGYAVQPDGPFLYTPYDTKILARYGALLAAILEHGISAMYVDVSPEIAQFCRILGLKVGHALMHGVRTDQAHSRLYDACNMLLFHNSKHFDTPAHRQTDTPIYYSGGISRLPKRHHDTPKHVQRILVTVSRAGSTFSLDDIATTARDFPHISWDIIGAIDGDTPEPNVTVHGIVDNIQPLYEMVDLVIGSGGNNIVMETASQRRPFVCIPEAKPFDEQIEAARSLERLHAAMYESAWPSAERWHFILDEYAQLDLDAFHALVDDDAAANAGQLISSLGD